MSTPRSKTISPSFSSQSTFRKYSTILKPTKTLNSLFIENNKMKTCKISPKNDRKAIDGVSEFVLEINENRKDSQISKSSSLKSVKGFDIVTSEKLATMKNSTLELLQDSIEELEVKYNSYIDYIQSFIFQREFKLSKMIGNEEDQKDNEGEILNYAEKNIFQQIDYIFEIHENLLAVIRDQIDLLKSFLKDFDLIFQRHPLEVFINSNGDKIMSSWLFSKVNFERINLSNLITNTNLSEIFKKYLTKKSENKFCSVNIGKRENSNFQIEKEFLQNNIKILQKIKFYNLSSEQFSELFNSNHKDANNLRTITIKSCTIKKNEFLKCNFSELKKLRIKNSIFNFNILSSSNFMNFKNLKNLEIKKSNFNDKNFMDFLNYVIDHKSLQISLTKLNFAKNCLTVINMKNFINKMGWFHNLVELNLEGNNIYDFISDNFKALPKLNLLNLSNNNISSFLLFNSIRENKKGNKNFETFTIMTNNIFITNNKENNSEYRKYFSQSISTYKYYIKSLSMCLMFNRFISEKLNEIIFSPSVKITLQALNLSYCGLNTDIVLKFLKNNFGLLSLKEINLSNNFLDNSFFVKYIGFENSETHEVNFCNHLTDAILDNKDKSNQNSEFNDTKRADSKKIKRLSNSFSNEEKETNLEEINTSLINEDKITKQVKNKDDIINNNVSNSIKQSSSSVHSDSEEVNTEKVISAYPQTSSASISNKNERLSFDSNYLLEKLEKIDLSRNNFHLKSIEELNNFSRFVLAHSKIKKIKLQDNEFEKDFCEMWNKFCKSRDSQENIKGQILDNLEEFTSRKIVILLNPSCKTFFSELGSSILKFKEKSI